MLSKIDKHHVDCDIKQLTPTEWESSGTAGAGSYPTLHELDASEIPTKPTAPTIDDGTTPVTNNTELQAMNGSGSYILTYDPDLTGVTWTPITGFSGTLDGNGHTISNLLIENVSASQQGLFGTVDDGFKAKDINFVDCSISTTSSRSDVGILVGGTAGAGDVTILLNNIHLTGCSVSMDDGSDSVGILCGFLDRQDATEIYNCSATDCSVTGAFQVGGMFGVFRTKDNPTNEIYITDCAVINLTMANAEGYPQWDTAYQMGGFIALPDNDGTGDGDPFVNFHSCYSTGTITADGGFDIGGFCASTGGNFRFVSCYSTVDIVVDMIDEWVGYDLSVVGGFTAVDTCYDIYIDCYATGDITVTNATEYATNLIGGFCGLTAFTETTSYLRCYSTGNISITSTHASSQAYKIGGFIGELRSWSYVAKVNVDSTDTITRCWSESDISINVAGTNKVYNIGGFIGNALVSKSASYVESLEIKDCYTWSEIDIENSAYSVGGFIGDLTINTQDDIIIDNCYVAQTDIRTGSGITNDLSEEVGNNINGFIGVITGTGSASTTNTFWDIETSGETSTPENGADGHTTAWMMTKSNYESAGWAFSTADGVKDDINSIWMIAVGASGTGDQYRTTAYPQDWSHLEGQTVQVVKDGIYLGDEAVSGGQITLDD